MNIEKKYGVMIATPCYGGQLTEAYLHGILQTTVKAQRMELKTDYEQAYTRLVAGDDTPSTRILPSTTNRFYT